jgi:uncharacterized protein (TIGR03790 family)
MRLFAFLVFVLFPLSLVAQRAGNPFVLAPLPKPADPSRMVILANASEAQSVELARYYAGLRGIPEANIAALPMPADETIDWATYVGSIHNPLRKWLRERGWISEDDVIADQFGRERGRLRRHGIDYVVICQGVPLRISDDPALLTKENGAAFLAATGQKMDAPPALLMHSFASVDSEIAAMAATGNPVAGFVPNPLYRRVRISVADSMGIIRTSRLGGADYAAARSLLDSADEAMKNGLRGRVYLDKGGPYPLAEQWLDRLALAFSAAGCDVELDEAKETFAPASRFDSPAIYFGWYASRANGPFLEPGMRLRPGAIAVHLFSFSASSLADRAQWCSALVDRGAAGTVGNVYEPTLGLTHDFAIMGHALLGGWSFADAAWCSMPALSWQGVILGDPLYTPLPRGIPSGKVECIPPVVGAVPPRTPDAMRMALEADPACLSLAFELAGMLHIAGKDGDAVLTLSPFAELERPDCGERSLAFAAARLLVQMDRKQEARAILERLRGQGVSPEFAKA